MLLDFSVKNFEEINNRITLNMKACNLNQGKDSLLGLKGQRYLPLSIVTGANCRGLDSLINALDYLLRDVMFLPLTSINAYEAWDDKKPTEFEITFSTDYAIYRYVVRLEGKYFNYEALYRWKLSTGRKAILFERTAYKHKLNRDEIARPLARQKDFELKLNCTQSLLSILLMKFVSNKDMNEIYTFAHDKVYFPERHPAPSEDIQRALIDYKEKVLEILGDIDSSIVDFQIKPSTNLSGRVTYRKTNGELKDFELSADSEKGRLLKLIGAAVYSLEQGGILFSKELDRGIHPLVLQYIFKMFCNKEINNKGAQLVFTTLNPSFLSFKDLRVDEIWFIERNLESTCSLYSYVEFKESKKKSKRKTLFQDYLIGRVGAIPCI